MLYPANHLDLRWDLRRIYPALTAAASTPTINRGEIDNWVSINFLCLNILRYDRGDTRVVRIIRWRVAWMR